jgi:hypothetical protein
VTHCIRAVWEKQVSSVLEQFAVKYKTWDSKIVKIQYLFRIDYGFYRTIESSVNSVHFAQIVDNIKSDVYSVPNSSLMPWPQQCFLYKKMTLSYLVYIWWMRPCRVV